MTEGAGSPGLDERVVTASEAGSGSAGTGRIRGGLVRPLILDDVIVPRASLAEAPAGQERFTAAVVAVRPSAVALIRSRGDVAAEPMRAAVASRAVGPVMLCGRVPVLLGWLETRRSSADPRGPPLAGPHDLLDAVS